MNQRLATISLLIFFGFAWLPLGQQAFMVEHWMKVGAFIAPVILFFGFKGRSDSTLPWRLDVGLIACLLTAAYLIHQIEEHWVDLLGREYPLYDYLNALIASLFGEDKYGVLDRSGIFYVNAGMVWTAGFLAILTSPRQVFPSLAMAGIMFVNAIAHVGSAVATTSYNAGLGTSVVLFLPLSIAFFAGMYRAGAANAKLLVAAILWGFLAHVILFAGLFASVVHGLIPVLAYYIALILWGVLPTIVSLAPLRILRPGR
ncbi:MAG: HXXEE domain-containing protein [Pseudomonadota bacterium]